MSDNKKSMKSYKNFSHTFTLQVLDPSSFPYSADGQKFNYTVKFKVCNNEIVAMHLPLLNFETFACYSDNNYFPGFTPAGGIVVTVDNPLPAIYRSDVDQTFLVSNNDGYYQPFDYNTYVPSDGITPTQNAPNPIAGFKVMLDSYGNLTISAAGQFYDIIPSGPHTLNSTNVLYQSEIGCNKIGKYNEFIIQSDYTNISLFQNRAANNGIRDYHYNDSFAKLSAWSWSDNSAQLDKSNNTTDLYVALGDISISGNLTMRAPLRLTNLDPQIMAFDTSIAINRDQTLFPGNVVAATSIVDRNTSLSLTGNIAGPLSDTIINVDNTNLVVGYLVSADTLGYVQAGSKILSLGVNTIVLDTPTTYPGVGPSPADVFTVITGDNFNTVGDISNGSTIIENIDTSPIFVGQYILGAGIQAGTFVTGFPSATSISINLSATATVLAQALTVVSSWNSPGYPFPGVPVVFVSNDNGLTFGSQVLIDPTIVFPVVMISDPVGVSCDKYGNMWYSVTVDVTGTYNIKNIWFYVSSDGGNNWVLYFQTIDATPGESYYSPQICFGNDGLGNYGLWFVANYLGLNAEGVLGFLPITGLNPSPIPSGDSINYYTKLPITLLNTVSTVTSIAIKEDGTLLIEYGAYLSYQVSVVNPVFLMVKPPGGFTTPLLGPWTVDTLANQWTAGVVSYPYGDGLSYPAVTPKNLIVDEERKALYAIVNEQLNFYSQDFNLFMVVSLDNGITWSKKYPVAKTHSQNRGFASATLNDGILYIGFYDARNFDIMKPVETLPYSSVQYYGVQMDRRYLDKIVCQVREDNPNPTYNIYQSPCPPSTDMLLKKTRMTPKFIKNNLKLKNGGR